MYGFKTYLYFLNEGKKSGEYSGADDILLAITNTQNWTNQGFNQKKSFKIRIG